VRVRLADGRVVDGVANIGRRPTVEGTELRVETHLFDFSGDLYGQEIAVGLIAYLRPEQRFASLDELRAQIARDSAAARAALAAA
jgi:riboflavin kinase/FMN adenylyltransferase